MVLNEGQRESVMQLVQLTESMYGSAATDRIKEAVAIAAGLCPSPPRHPQQRSAGFIFPGLTATGWHERSEIAMVAQLEAHWRDVLDELMEMVGRRTGFQDYLPIDDPRAIVPEEWKAMYLKQGLIDCSENRALCPGTVRLLEALPRVGEAVFFSALNPAGHIKPHSGDWNCRLNLHLPLVVPEKCGIRVGQQERRWEPGTCLVFDDSFEHEAWNHGDHTRFVLLVNTWHPELTDVEIGFLSTVGQQLAKDEFERQAEVARSRRFELAGKQWWVEPVA